MAMEECYLGQLGMHARPEKGMAEPSGTKAPALVKIYGDPRSSASYSIHDFLHRSDVGFEFVPLTTDEEARSQAGVLHLRDSRLPVCVFPDGTHMECPTIRQITEKLGWFVDPSAPNTTSRSMVRAPRA